MYKILRAGAACACVGFGGVTCVVQDPTVDLREVPDVNCVFLAKENVRWRETKSNRWCLVVFLGIVIVIPFFSFSRGFCHVRLGWLSDCAINIFTPT